MIWTSYSIVASKLFDRLSEAWSYEVGSVRRSSHLLQQWCSWRSFCSSSLHCFLSSFDVWDQRYWLKVEIWVTMLGSALWMRCVHLFCLKKLSLHCFDTERWVCVLEGDKGFASQLLFFFLKLWFKPGTMF